MELVGSAAGIAVDRLSLVEHERPLIRLDGKTPIIDLPRLRSTAGRHVALDSRISVAICTDDLSSKVWARVGLPFPTEGTSAPLGTKIDLFRNLAKSSADWAFALVVSVVKEVDDNLAVVAGRRLDVTVIGTSDAAIEPYLEKLRDPTASATDVFLMAGTDKELLPYFEAAKPPRTEVPASHSSTPEAFWFSSPFPVVRSDGSVVLRDVLYYMNVENGTSHAIGVGFDDSEAYDLAQRSSLTVARWIANRI